MARKIVIIRAVTAAPDVGFRYALWADVPAARQSRYANALATTEVADVTAGELSALQSGAVVEKVEEARWPSGTTVAQMQTFLQARFADYQAQITAANPWQRSGTSWDGTTWSVTNNG